MVKKHYGLCIKQDNRHRFGAGEPGETVGTCPMCGKDLVFSKAGVSCTGYHESGCTFVIWRTVSGKTLTDANLKLLAKAGKTKVIKGFKSKKTGKVFEAALMINEEHKPVSYTHLT